MGERRKRWTPEDLEELRLLYEGGMTFREVGRQLGYSNTYLARRFKQAGFTARPGGCPFAWTPPDVDLEELVRLREAGWTFPQLSEKYGLSTDAVRTRYLRAKGRPLRRTEAERRGIPFPAKKRPPSSSRSTESQAHSGVQ